MPYKQLPEITEKQQEIIELVFQFRFINRKQLQVILGHADARRINAWLKDLVAKEYLGRIYSHKLLENTKPAIYFLHNAGVRWCQINMGIAYDRHDEMLTNGEIKKFYEDKHASKTFIDHCLFVVDIYVQYKQWEKTASWHMDFLSKTVLWTIDREQQDFAERKQYIPDVAIETFSESGDEQVYYLISIDPHMPRYALEYIIRLYMRFAEEELWNDCALLCCPTFLFILPNKRKLHRLARYIQQQQDDSYSDMQAVNFFLTTKKEVLEKTMRGPIWTHVGQTVEDTETQTYLPQEQT